MILYQCSSTIVDEHYYRKTQLYMNPSIPSQGPSAGRFWGQHRCPLPPPWGCLRTKRLLQNNYVIFILYCIIIICNNNNSTLGLSEDDVHGINNNVELIHYIIIIICSYNSSTLGLSEDEALVKIKTKK